MLTNFEAGWAECVLSSFAPEGGPGLAPRQGEVRWAPSFERMREAANWKARFGMRVALWIVVFAPLFVFGAGKTLLGFSPGERARWLGKMLAHPFFLIRELALLLKVMACMTMLGTASIRARSRYDEGAYRDAWERDHVRERAENSVRAPRRLPVMVAA